MGVGGVAVVAQPVGGMQRRAGTTKKKRKKTKEAEVFPDVSTPNAAQIAKKHGVSVDKINAQLRNGIQVELEHTGDKNAAKEIALDHLNEFPDYYDRLKKAEQ
jgi:hypothetical protein